MICPRCCEEMERVKGGYWCRECGYFQAESEVKRG
jgi:tRNA(Ile2) C34 agmatinyltransferase TiaS